MYVHPDFRRRGIARALVQAAITEARRIDDLEQLSLCVTTACKPACALYEAMGFQRFGLEPDALRQNGQSYDIAYMKLLLTSI